MAKSKIIMIRVTKDEHAKITALAGPRKISAYVRECSLLGIAEHAPVEPPFMDYTVANQLGKEDPVALWQSNLNYWYRTNEGCKEMLEELGHALITRMEKLPMEQRAAFLAQELG